LTTQLILLGICIIVSALGIETLRSNWHLLNSSVKVMAGGLMTLGVLILMISALEILLTLLPVLLQ